MCSKTERAKIDAQDLVDMALDCLALSDAQGGMKGYNANPYWTLQLGRAYAELAQAQLLLEVVVELDTRLGEIAESLDQLGRATEGR